MPKTTYLEEEEGKEEGELDEDVYTEEGREELVEDDEITEIEQGFAEGYEKGEMNVKCQNCGKLLTNENPIEREIRGDTYYFCSITCAEQYVKKKKVV